MNKKILIILVLAVATILTIANFVTSKGNKLVEPTRMQQITTQPAASPKAEEPPATPPTFIFNSSTNLKQELEKVNPQILDSDFE